MMFFFLEKFFHKKRIRKTDFLRKRTKKNEIKSTKKRIRNSVCVCVLKCLLWSTFELQDSVFFFFVKAD